MIYIYILDLYVRMLMEPMFKLPSSVQVPCKLQTPAKYKLKLQKMESVSWSFSSLYYNMSVWIHLPLRIGYYMDEVHSESTCISLSLVYYDVRIWHCIHDLCHDLCQHRVNVYLWDQWYWYMHICTYSLTEELCLKLINSILIYYVLFSVF